MAWNPSPEVAIARDAAKKFGEPIVVCVLVHPAKRSCRIVSYGADKDLCQMAKKIADQICDDLESGRLDIDV